MPVRVAARRRRHTATVVWVGLLTVVAACGDDTAAEGPVTSGEVAAPDGTPLADGLIDELAAIPLPDEVGFGDGVVYDEDDDTRRTAAQLLFFAMPTWELAAFYLDALPSAGFTVEAGDGTVVRPQDIVDDQPIVILFTTPDGLPGRLTITPGVLSPSEMNINIYRSGFR